MVNVARMNEALAESVSDAVRKEVGPILEMQATRISQQELSYRADKKVSVRSGCSLNQ